MSAIYKRELSSYFNSMIGYVFIAVLVFFTGIYFMAYNLYGGLPQFSYTLYSLMTILMFAIPLLTMKSMAEERRSRTDQLLLTAPVSLTGVVMGKFLAMATIFLIPVALCAFCPLIIAMNGEARLLSDYAALLAFFLMGCVFIAIGMFLSSLTESQIIAAVSTFAVLLVLMIGWVGGFPELYVQAGALTGSDPSKSLLSLFNDRYTPLICMSMFWGWGLGLAANPQYMVRVLSARNPRSARWTVLGSLILLAFLYFALVHIGLAARVLAPQSPEVASSDEIIVHLMNNELYSVWSGFFLFSVIGACVSTANSQLLLIASSFSYDIIRTVSPKEVSERQVLNLGRLAVFGGGTISMLLALNPPEFTLSYGGDVWGGVSILLFPATYGTLLCRRVTKQGVWASVLVGGAAILTLYPAYYGGLLPLHPALPGVILSTAALLVGSALSRREEAAQ